MNEREKPLDDAPGAIYRTLPREEPPSAIDSAVLDAARRSVERRPNRRWGASLAAAAVLVLAVGVTFRVADERPDEQSKPVTAPPANPTAAKIEAPKSPAPGGPTPPLVKPVDGRPAVIAAKPQVAESVQPEREHRGAESDPGVSPVARQERTMAASASGAVVEAPPPTGTAAAPSVAASAPSSQFAPSRRADTAPAMAKSASSESNLAAAPAPQSPEAWLERIVALRARAQHKEADESYAEFRQRFPGYTIAPEMLLKIAPPR